MAARSPGLDEYIHQFARDFDFGSKVEYEDYSQCLYVRFTDEFATPPKHAAVKIPVQILEASDLTILNAHLNHLVRALC